jgi:hypothetical protein
VPRAATRTSSRKQRTTLHLDEIQGAFRRMSPGGSEEPPGRHDVAGFAAGGIASDTLSRAALRARHPALAAHHVPLIGFCQSNDHEHTTSICNLGEEPLASRSSTE